MGIRVTINRTVKHRKPPERRFVLKLPDRKLQNVRSKRPLDVLDDDDVCPEHRERRIEGTVVEVW